MLTLLKKINWIYILAAAALLWIIPAIRSRLQHNEEFYGIAENQIRAYTRPADMIIQQIRVKLGQQVAIGDTLMVFHPKNLYYKKEDLASQSRIIDIDLRRDHFKLRQQLQQVEEQKKLVEEEYNIKFEKLTVKKRLRDSLNVLVKAPIAQDIAYDSEFKALQDLKSIDIAALDQKMSSLQRALTSTPDPGIEKQQSIRTEIQRINELEKDLVLIADMNGVVGELDLQDGDPVEAYRSLIKLYSNHPTLVTTYISETYLGKVSVKDSVIIQSLSDPAYRLIGKILNLGSRISALPDRLKKIPEIKTWGREVQLEIPSENKLIQGEKVNVIFSSPGEPQ